MKKNKDISPLDLAEYFASQEAINAFWEDTFKDVEEDLAYLAHALKVVSGRRI